MRIDSLVSLIGGELKSRPAVASLASIAFDPAKVGRGDLFVAKKKEQIPLAIERGAYGVLFEGWAQISDPEIAWIKVADLDKAVAKLLRFELIRERPALFGLDPLTFDLAREIVSDGALFMGREPAADLAAFLKKRPHTILYDHTGYIHKLGLEEERIDPLPISLRTATLFESSFVAAGRYHERVPIPPLFLPHLAKILAIAESRGLSYSLRQRPTSHFRPIFVDAGLKEVEFGASDRVIIHEPSLALAQEVRSYVQSHAPWAKSLFVSTTHIEGYLHAPNVEALKEILYNWPFQYLCVAGEMPPLEILQKRRKEPSLF